MLWFESRCSISETFCLSPFTYYAAGGPMLSAVRYLCCDGATVLLLTLYQYNHVCSMFPFPKLLHRSVSVIYTEIDIDIFSKWDCRFTLAMTDDEVWACRFTLANEDKLFAIYGIALIFRRRFAVCGGLIRVSDI